MDKMSSITPEDLADSRERFGAERVNAVAKNAVTASGIRAAARRPEGVAANALGFDLEVTQGDRCNQERSGRCWMFASLNTMRYRVIKKYNLKTFELSQAYPLFWDKLEKSNWFLQNILDTLDEPLDGRLVSFLLADPIGDGGQWDMFRSLVKKYGVVPKEAMPETACSRNTRELDRYLTRYLRGAAKRLRQSHEAGVGTDDLLAMKKQMMDEVYHLLAVCLGEPPASFSVRLRDKDQKLALSGTFTPQELFKTAVDMDVDAYVSLISAPTRVVWLRRRAKLSTRRGHHGHGGARRGRTLRLPRGGLHGQGRAPGLRREPHDPRHGAGGRPSGREGRAHAVEG